MSEEKVKPESKPEPKPEKKVEKEAEIVTIHDFKSMLVGMDLVLGDNWTPSEEQWKRIRKKLDALIETAEQPVTNTRIAHPQSNVRVDPSSNVSEDILRNFPQVPVADNIPIGEAAPVGQSALAPPQAPPQQQPTTPAPMATREGEQVKTPDIDSSSGYKSSFV